MPSDLITSRDDERDNARKWLEMPFHEQYRRYDDAVAQFAAAKADNARLREALEVVSSDRWIDLSLTEQDKWLKLSQAALAKEDTHE